MSDPDTQQTIPSDSTPSSPAARLLAAYAAGERAFVRVDLAGADLQGADLQDGKFFGADFTGADLSGADLRRADLAYAKLTRANLRGANLSEAKLEGADLTGADMTDTIKDSPHPTPAAALATTPTVPGAPQRFCLNCHSPVASEAAFCQACGASLAANPGVPGAAPTSQANRALQMTAPVSRPSTSLTSPSVAPRSAASNRPATKASSGSMNGFMLILALIFGAWDFIWKLTVIILVIVGGVILIKQFVASHSLSTSSNCQQYQQADSSAQDRVLQQLMTEHHDNESLTTVRFLMNAYCDLSGGNAPLEGAYGSGHVGAGPDQASHGMTPALVYLVYARPA